MDINRKTVRCCNCGRIAPNRGFGLCHACHALFTSGEFRHPVGGFVYSSEIAAKTVYIQGPQSTFAPDSDLSLLNGFDHLALPANVDPHPAVVSQPYAVEEYDFTTVNPIDVVNELVRAA